jgi:hypothetical protein
MAFHFHRAEHIDLLADGLGARCPIPRPPARSPKNWSSCPVGSI